MRLRLKKKQKKMLFDIALMLFCYILGIVIGAYAWGRPEIKIAKNLTQVLDSAQAFCKAKLGADCYYASLAKFCRAPGECYYWVNCFVSERGWEKHQTFEVRELGEWGNRSHA